MGRETHPQRLTRPAGQAMVEYALVLGLVSVLAVGGLLLFGTALQAHFAGLAATLAEAFQGRVPL